MKRKQSQTWDKIRFEAVFFCGLLCSLKFYKKFLVNGEKEIYVNKNTSNFYLLSIGINILYMFLGLTVSIDGNVFTFNIENNEMNQVTDYPVEIQITELENKNGKLMLKGTEYVEDILNEFKEFKAEMELNELI